MSCSGCPYNDNNWCDKVGGKKQWYGYCEDYKDNTTTTYHAYKQTKQLTDKQKHIRTLNNKIKYKNKLKKQYKESYNKWFPPSKAVYKDEYISYIYRYAIDKDELEVLYYKKLYKSSHCQRYKYYKKYSNKILRNDNDIYKCSQYKKMFDYRWAVN